MMSDETGSSTEEQTRDENAAIRRSTLRQNALEAEKRGDVDKALELWTAFRKHSPESSLGLVAVLRVLRQAKRFDAAGQTLKEALEQFPQDVDVLVAGARYYDATKRAEEADALWQRVVALSPDNQEYSLAACLALTRMKKGRRRQMPLVLERFNAHHKRFPADTAAYCGHIDAFRLSKGIQRLTRLYDFDALSAAWCARFPDNVEIALARAALLEDLDRNEQAVAEISALRERLPATPAVEAAYMRVLSCAGRVDEAEQVFKDAVVQFPAEKKLIIEHARLASRQGDWREVERRLLQGQALLPRDNQIARELNLARQMLLGSDEPADQGSPGPDAKAPEHVEPEAVSSEAALMKRFESLGGTGMGCEFGMLQRQMGNDSVTLLRWSETGPADMVAALACEFEGVGDEANTELKTARHGLTQEYVTLDKRFNMGSHTFVKTSDAPADRMLTQSCRRLRFLRGKLLEELRLCEKIFVYRAQDPISDEEIMALHAGLSRYGDNALLCVTRGGEGRQPGTLRVLGRGVYVGYVAHFKNQSGEPSGAGTDVAGWLDVCRQADATWQAARAGQQAA